MMNRKTITKMEVMCPTLTSVWATLITSAYHSRYQWMPIKLVSP